MDNYNGLWLCVKWDGIMHKEGKVYLVKNNSITNENNFTSEAIHSIKCPGTKWVKINSKLAKLLYV